jgi:quinol-cytochrome oxidoreductase complex cytochrome b subunit
VIDVVTTIRGLFSYVRLVAKMSTQTFMTIVEYDVFLYEIKKSRSIFFAKIRRN